MASQVALEVVISADNADFSGLDDDGVDDGTEPGLAALDGASRQTPDESLSECFHDLGIECRLFDQIGAGALERGLGVVTLLPDFLHAALERGFGGIEDAGFDRAIEVLERLLGLRGLLLQLIDAPVDRFLLRGLALMESHQDAGQAIRCGEPCE